MALHVDDGHRTGKLDVTIWCSQYALGETRRVEVDRGLFWNVMCDFLKSRRAFKGEMVLTIANARYLDRR